MATTPSDRLEDEFQEVNKSFVNITEFKKFARSKDGLCLDDCDVQQIAENNRHSVEEQKIQMQNKWKEKHGKRATVPWIRSIVKSYQKRRNSTDYIILSQGLFGLYKKRTLCKRGHVYRGEQISEATGTHPCAIKLIIYNKNNLREAKILMKLRNHQNVVCIIHADIYKTTLHKYIFIAMELCSTKNLQDIFDKSEKLGTSFDETTAWDWIMQLLDALSFIHSQDIVHRDMKPVNILFSEDLKYVKLIDYGLSKELTHGSATKLSIANPGTDGFRSPETYNENVLTKKSDVFSAGITVAMVLSNGRHPFGNDPDLWNYKIKKFKNPDLCFLLVSEIAQAESLISAMLQTDPKIRLTAKTAMEKVKLFLKSSEHSTECRTAKLTVQQTDQLLTVTSREMDQQYAVDQTSLTVSEMTGQQPIVEQLTLTSSDMTVQQSTAEQLLSFSLGKTDQQSTVDQIFTTASDVTDQQPIVGHLSPTSSGLAGQQSSADQQLVAPSRKTDLESTGDQMLALELEGINQHPISNSLPPGETGQNFRSDQMVGTSSKRAYKQSIADHLLSTSSGTTDLLYEVDQIMSDSLEMTNQQFTANQPLRLPETGGQQYSVDQILPDSSVAKDQESEADQQLPASSKMAGQPSTIDQLSTASSMTTRQQCADDRLSSGKTHHEYTEDQPLATSTERDNKQFIPDNLLTISPEATEQQSADDEILRSSSKTREQRFVDDGILGSSSKTGEQQSVDSDIFGSSSKESDRQSVDDEELRSLLKTTDQQSAVHQLLPASGDTDQICIVEHLISVASNTLDQQSTVDQTLSTLPEMTDQHFQADSFSGKTSQQLKVDLPWSDDRPAMTGQSSLLLNDQQYTLDKTSPEVKYQESTIILSKRQRDHRYTSLISAEEKVSKSAANQHSQKLSQFPNRKSKAKKVSRKSERVRSMRVQVRNQQSEVDQLLPTLSKATDMVLPVDQQLGTLSDITQHQFTVDQQSKNDKFGETYQQPTGDQLSNMTVAEVQLLPASSVVTDQQFTSDQLSVISSEAIGQQCTKNIKYQDKRFEVKRVSQKSSKARKKRVNKSSRQPPQAMYQQPRVDQPSPKESDPQTTALQQSPITSKEMKSAANQTSTSFQVVKHQFSEEIARPTKPTITKANAIIFFDWSDYHLYSYKPSTKKLNQMKQTFIGGNITTVAMETHMYILREGQEVNRLEYSDSASEWTKIENMNDNHGDGLIAAISNGSVYVCGGCTSLPNGAERYDIAQSRWIRITSMNIARKSPCIVAANGNIYCIGGLDNEGNRLQSAELFEKRTGEWKNIEPTPREIAYASAALFGEQIYVVDSLGILCYHILNNSWQMMNLKDKGPFEKSRIVKILIVDKKLYLISFARKKLSIYLLEPRTEQLILVEAFNNKKIDVYASVAVNLQ